MVQMRGKGGLEAVVIEEVGKRKQHYMLFRREN